MQRHYASASHHQKSYSHHAGAAAREAELGAGAERWQVNPIDKHNILIITITIKDTATALRLTLIIRTEPEMQTHFL